MNEAAFKRYCFVVVCEIFTIFHFNIFNVKITVVLILKFHYSLNFVLQNLSEIVMQILMF